MTRQDGRRIVVLTGAGISAESGLGTFRGGAAGLWARFDPMKLATPVAFAADPAEVQAFYNMRRRTLLEATANAAHAALARLQSGLAERGDTLTLITQNVDDLHERAGSARLLHMHGELLKIRCGACGVVSPWRDDLDVGSRCPGCGRAGGLRPHVVWFGEEPLHLAEIDDAMTHADLFVAIGTSGSVYPAAGLVRMARLSGIRTCELNLAPADNHQLFDESRYGPATAVVPAWVDEVLGTQELP